MQTLTLSVICRIIKKVSKEREGKLILGIMDENHGMCEDTGKQHGRIFRHRGSGIYEKCGSEPERNIVPIVAVPKDCYQMAMQKYKKQPDVLKDLLFTVLASITELPVVKQPKITSANLELLAVFSARSTGNPHYYDDGTPGGKLLVAFQKYYLRGDFPEAPYHADIKKPDFL